MLVAMVRAHEEGRCAAVLCDNVLEEKPRSAAGLFGPEGGAPRVLRLVLCVEYAFLFAPDLHTELREKDPLSASGERVGMLALTMFRSRATPHMLLGRGRVDLARPFFVLRAARIGQCLSLRVGGSCQLPVWIC